MPQHFPLLVKLRYFSDTWVCFISLMVLYSPWKALGLVSGLCVAIAQSQSTLASNSPSNTPSPTQFTIPSSAYAAPTVLPNIVDPQAVDPQKVCSGYIASNVKNTLNGLTASLSLAGEACNVYGTDISSLKLSVEYQAADRLHVEIVPTYLDVSNATQYLIPSGLVARPQVENRNASSDLQFSWTNKPSFAFTVTRKSTGDVLFSTEGKKLVFENQFLEISSSLPENYNLYGLGESVRPFRQGNNYTQTFYAADAGDTVD